MSLIFCRCPLKLICERLLGVYELNRIDLLRDVFVWAYERSCLRYSIIGRELGTPDPFRMRYRNQIVEVVVQIVRERQNKTNAIATIRSFAQQFIPSVDQMLFIEAVEKDLMSLHEGNFARHRIRPSEFYAWQENWH